MGSQVLRSKDKTGTITSFSIETLISDLKMNFSVIVLILLRYSIHRAGLISEKMKVSKTEHDVRPVGSRAVHLKGHQKWREEHPGIPLVLKYSSLRNLLSWTRRSGTLYA